MFECSMFGWSVPNIDDEICVVYGDEGMSFSTVYSRFTNSVPVMNQSKMLFTRGDLGLQ